MLYATVTCKQSVRVSAVTTASNSKVIPNADSCCMPKSHVNNQHELARLQGRLIRTLKQFFSSLSYLSSRELDGLTNNKKLSTQNYWASELCPSSGILKTIKQTN
jgi:hypothetical protein